MKPCPDLWPRDRLANLGRDIGGACRVQVGNEEVVTTLGLMGGADTAEEAPMGLSG